MCIYSLCVCIFIKTFKAYLITYYNQLQTTHITFLAVQDLVVWRLFHTLYRLFCLCWDSHRHLVELNLFWFSDRANAHRISLPYYSPKNKKVRSRSYARKTHSPCCDQTTFNYSENVKIEHAFLPKSKHILIIVFSVVWSCFNFIILKLELQ